MKSFYTDRVMDGTRLLLVEDSEEGQLVVKTALARSGIDITSALSFEAAKTIIHQSSNRAFDLIMLDLVLPDGDGMGLFELILNHPGLKSVPVVMLTGKDDIFDKIQAFELGIEEYLVKPVNPIDLKERIEAILLKRNKQS